MAVTFDATGTASAATATTVSVTMTVGSSGNRAVAVGLAFGVNTVTDISVSGGGASNWAVVQGTDTGGLQAVRTVIWGAKAPSSGSQTFTASWTGASDCVMGVVTVQGCNQPIPLKNGASQSAAAATSDTLALLNSNNDFPMDTVANLSTLTSPTQTQRWNSVQTTVTGGGSTGSGANLSFGWSSGALTAWAHSGAVFNSISEEPGGSGDEGTLPQVAQPEWPAAMQYAAWQHEDPVVPAAAMDEEVPGGARSVNSEWLCPILTASRQEESIVPVVDEAAVGGAGIATVPPGSSVTFALAMDDIDAVTIPDPTLAIDDEDIRPWFPRRTVVTIPSAVDDIGCGGIVTTASSADDPAVAVLFAPRPFRVPPPETENAVPTVPPPPPPPPGSGAYASWQSVIIHQ